jgi:hypothetical protein
MTDFSDLVEADLAPGWRPKEGDKLVGKVTDLTLGWSDYTQSNYPIVTVHDEDKDEDVAIHCFHYVLKKKMEELKPQVGERIGVAMTGSKPSKDGRRTITLYSVKVEGRSTDIWGATPDVTPPKSAPSVEEVGEVSIPDDEVPY